MTSVSRAVFLPLVALALVLSGCSGAAEQAPTSAKAGRESGAHRSAPPTSKPSPTVSAAPSSPATQKRDRDGSRGKTAPLLPLRRVTLDSHLLAGDRLPVVEQAAWTVTGEGPEDTRRAGTCQKTSLESIGAVSAIRRTFTVRPADKTGAKTGAKTAGRAKAVQVVARFADDKSAWRAHRVLAAWREDCAERLDYARRDVGPMKTVRRVRAGVGENYLARYGPKAREKGRAAGFGIVRTGSYLSVVEIRTRPDAYPTKRDPVRIAVRRISRTFG